MKIIPFLVCIVLSIFLKMHTSYAMDFLGEESDARGLTVLPSSTLPLFRVLEEQIALKNADIKQYLAAPTTLPKDQFLKAESVAKALAKRVFCLADQDKERTWLWTVYYHALFWTNYRNEDALRELATQGCSLAQSYLMIGEESLECDESIVKPPTSTIVAVINKFILLISLCRSPQDLIDKELVIPEDEKNLNRTCSVIQGQLEFALQEKLKQIYRNFIKKKRHLFILFWQLEMPFLIGLDLATERELYLEAQESYRQQFGQIYMYSDYFSKQPLEFPCWNRLSVSSEEFEKMLMLERDWGAVVDRLGDYLVAYELAKAWKNSKFEDSEQKAQFWFERYRSLAPTLPFGDLCILEE